MNWIKATPEERWANGGVYWVTIRCTADGSLSVGILAGGAKKSVAITKNCDTNDGRGYVVTHYCPMEIPWPAPAEEV